MEYKLQNAAPQPTLHYTVTDLDGRPARLVAFSGVVTVAPGQQRGVVVRTTVEQPGSPIGFYVPEAFAVPLARAIAVARRCRRRWSSTVARKWPPPTV
jgi:hypothetical protein